MESWSEEIRVCKGEHRVLPEHLAAHLKARGRRVLSTPCLVLMMEVTARECLDELLGGRTSVGYRVDVRHRRPVEEGSIVHVEARLVDFDGRRAVFYIRAYSGDELVAEAIHERFVVEG